LLPLRWDARIQADFLDHEVFLENGVALQANSELVNTLWGEQLKSEVVFIAQIAPLERAIGRSLLFADRVLEVKEGGVIAVRQQGLVIDFERRNPRVVTVPRGYTRVDQNVVEQISICGSWYRCVEDVTACVIAHG